MRSFSTHCIRYHALRIQTRAFYAGVAFGLAFMGCAIAGLERYAMTAAILGSVAIGVSIGAWVVAMRFKD